MLSFSLLSHTPDPMERLAARDTPASPAGTASERHAALWVALVATFAAILMVLASA